MLSHVQRCRREVLQLAVFAHYADPEFYRRQARVSSPSYKAPVVDASTSPRGGVSVNGVQ